MFITYSCLNLLHRYVPSTKGTDPPTNGNVRQSQIVAQQLFTLKTTINHLKNAYNGNDVEWPDNGEFQCVRKEKCNFYQLLSITDDTEEPEPDSGSGSGSGIDDSDDDDGSGAFENCYKFFC